MEQQNNLPDINSIDSFNNPTLVSPNSAFTIQFAQTRETLFDVETYREFLQNAIKRFRQSITYKHYKSFLIGLGMDRCQFHGNITSEMATLEMHHNMITIFDIALIITEHVLNTTGYITTFDLVKLLKQEHTKHRVQLVMLSLTPHQLYHNTTDFFIHPDMCFGNWVEFLDRYNKGLTQDVAFKILFYIKRAIEKGESDDGGLLDIREKILNWNQYNNCYR